MISAVVLTKNEETNIADCLKTLKWCDEILVIDDNSTDATREIAKLHGANVIIHELTDDFSRQRNFALSQTKGEWILYIDADERVPAALASELQASAKNSTYNGFSLKRIDLMWNKKLLYGETGKKTFIRFGKKNAGIWHGKVHEVWSIKGSVGTCNKSLTHYPHQTLDEFLGKINFYTTLRSQELFEQNTHANFLSILAYPIGKFFVDYIIKQGFRDGTAGIILAILMSFHSFLVRGKLWLLWRKR